MKRTTSYAAWFRERIKNPECAAAYLKACLERDLHDSVEDQDALIRDALAEIADAYLGEKK